MSQNENLEKPQNSTGNDFILHSLIDSGFNPSSLKTIFEKGVQTTFVKTLNDYIEGRQNEVKQLCNNHYEDFLLAITRLNESRETADELKQKIKLLNDEVQENGRITVESTTNLLKHRRIAENIDKTLRTIRWCRVVSILSMEATEQMQKSQYFHALETLNRLERSIQRVRQYSFAKQLELSIPICRQNIKDNASSKFNKWLDNVKEKAFPIGNFILNHIQQKMKNATIFYDSEYEEGDVFKVCDVSLSDVYFCKMIYAKLNASAEFATFFKTNREVQISYELRFKVRSFDLMLYHAWLSRILGYFEVEYHILKSTDNLITAVEFKKIWENAREKVQDHLANYFENTIDPHNFLAMKDLVSGLCFALSSRMRLDVQPILDLMQKYTSQFSTIVSSVTKNKIREIVKSESFSPLSVNSAEQYTQLASKNLVSRQNFQERLQAIRFPITLNFSNTVLEICTTVEDYMKQFFQYSQFLTDLDEIIKNGLNELLQDAEASFEKLIDETPYGALGHYAQIAVNAEGIIQACVYFEEEFYRAKQNNLAQLGITNSREIGDIPTNHENSLLKVPRMNFGKIRDRAEDRIQKSIFIKIDELLGCAEKTDWISTNPLQEMHQFADDLITYLQTTLQVISIIPREKVEGIAFNCAQHISSVLLSILMRSSILSYNSLRIILKDISGLKSALQLYDRNSTNCFLEIEAMVQVLLEANFSTEVLQTWDNDIIEKLLQDFMKIVGSDSQNNETRFPGVRTNLEKLMGMLKKFEMLHKSAEIKPSSQKKKSLFRLPFGKSK